MLNDYFLVSAGTAAAVLAILLLLLRLELAGARPALRLTRQWVATDRLKSSIVLALVTGAAAVSFASVPSAGRHDVSPAAQAAGIAHKPILEQLTDPEAEADFNSLASYANSIATGSSQAPPAASPATDKQNLPDVSTMIENLVRRLETETGDVRGWKMLGWSYLNTNQPKEAVTAYERALALAPADDDARKGLEQARTAAAASPAKEPVNAP